MNDNIHFFHVPQLYHSDKKKKKEIQNIDVHSDLVIDELNVFGNKCLTS